MKKLKFILATVFVIAAQSAALACDACQKQQPKITAEFTHGAGPTSNWDWVIVAVISIITVATLIYSIKYLVAPGEKSASHIKNSILRKQPSHE
mgnify:CR=1 FL=1